MMTSDLTKKTHTIMEQPGNQIQTSEKIENLKDFDIWKIRDESCDYIFDAIRDNDKELKEFLQRFDDIYYLSASPFKIEEYEDRPVIYEILKRYEWAANWYPLEIMLFKIKEISEEEKQKLLERLRKEYEWFPVKLDESRYLCTVWFFGWTSWRTNSYYMGKIREIYPVKTLIK